MLGSIVLVAAFTATLSSQMTTESVAGAISGPDGLPGRTVATVRGSSAVKSLRSLRVSVREFTDLAAAIAGVSDGQAEALVFDAPVLAHAVTEDSRSPIRLVGPLFEHQDSWNRPSPRQRSAKICKPGDAHAGRERQDR